jgi:hypothetical protein
MRRCRRSSQRRRRSTSCSQFHASACLIPSPFGRGERNNKHFVGLVSNTLAIGRERGRGVDPELSEHSGNIRGRGGCRDRSRSKDGSIGAEGLQGSEVDDGDGDRNRGVDGVLLR